MAEPDVPDALVVFDGVCNLCSATVRTIAAMDRDGVIAFTPVQSAYGRKLCRRAGVDPDAPSTFLFFDHGRAKKSSEAALALAARLPAPWPALRLLAIVPRPLRDAAYGVVARNRYRVFGRRRACLRPDAALAGRFVEDDPAA